MYKYRMFVCIRARVFRENEVAGRKKMWRGRKVKRSSYRERNACICFTLSARRTRVRDFLNAGSVL